MHLPWPVASQGTDQAMARMVGEPSVPLGLRQSNREAGRLFHATQALSYRVLYFTLYSLVHALRLRTNRPFRTAGTQGERGSTA